jgi:hypothetical protein
MLTLPESGAQDGQGFKLVFKHFQRIEGIFRVKPTATVDTVQVRVYDSASGQARATQSVKLG